VNKREPIHAIYVHTFYYDLITPLLLRLIFKIPLLIKPPSDFDTQQREVFMSKPHSIISRMVYYGWMKFFNFYLIKLKNIYYQAINDKIYRDLRNKKVSSKSILRLPNGISIKKYSQIKKNKKASTHFGYVGRLLKTKNIRFLLNVFVKYFEEYPMDKLYIFGKGPEHIYIFKFINEHDLGKNIILWGFERSKKKIYQEIDVLVHPSLGEGCPNTILESILTNTFVIGANITGIRDIIKNKETGLLFNPFNEEDLLKKLIFYKEHQELISRILKNAKSRVIEKYDINRVADKIYEFLKIKWAKRFKKTRLKIAVLTPVFPYPKRGVLPGIERYIESFTIPIKKLGYDIKIVTCFWNGGEKYDTYHGIPILRIRDSKALLGKIGSIFHLNNITFGLNLTRRKHVRFYQDCHVVIMPLALGFNSFFKIKKVPLISGFLHYDNVTTTMEHFTLPFYHRLEKRQFKTHTRVMTISEASKIEIVKKYNISPENIKVIPIGISMEKFNPKYHSNSLRKRYGKNILLYVGPFIKRKRIPVLLKAMPKVIQEVPDVQLILIGEGLLWNYCKELTNYLRIEEHVHFLGFIKEGLLSKYYASSDIYVFPSELEGFGQVLLEAMASGTPVICANKPPMCEIIGNGGVTFKVNDPDDLAKKIVYLLKNRDILNELKKRSLEIVKKFDQIEIAKKYINYFQEVSKSRKYFLY